MYGDFLKKRSAFKYRIHLTEHNLYRNLNNRPVKASGCRISKNKPPIKAQTAIVVGMQNIRSLFSKLNFVSNTVTMDNIDFLFLTETWLDNRILDSMISINDFEILRCDRLVKKGGGVALYHKKSIYVQKLQNPVAPSTFFNFEFMCVRLDTSKCKIHFLIFYVPPDSSQCPSTIINVCKVISFFLISTAPFIILGDFNLPKINWTNSTANGQAAEIFLNFCVNNALTQCIDSATHKDGNVLDLLLCNLPALSILISSSVNCPISSTCDHNLVLSSLSVSVPSSQKYSYSFPNFKKANFENINNILLSYNWNLLLYESSLQNQYDVFISIMQNVIKNNVPYLTHSNKPRKSLPKHMKKLLNTKLKTYRLFKSGKCSKEVYKSKAKEYEVEVNKWHDRVEENICFNPSSKKFYSYANKKLNNSFTLPPLLNSDNDVISTDIGKANLLNETFHQHFTIDNNTSFSPFHKLSSPMLDFQVSAEDVLQAVRESKDKLSLTPEQIPAYFIKRVIISILQPLLLIYSNSLEFSSLPHQWKQSIITPIFKKGDRRLPSNYRPVAQTSSFGRILEAILSKKILEHLMSNQLLLPNQFGFLPHRSSASQLLYCLDCWYSSYCSNKIQFVAYTDISKAFDSVSHSKLVKVLTSFGLNKIIVLWIQNFLMNRTQFVRINKTFSSPLPILSGVPQGSVLGPLLFLLFINDIVQIVELRHDSNFALFADDAKIFSDNAQELQSCLDHFNDVLSNYQLNLAPHKCFILPISKHSQQISISSHPSFSINSISLSYENSAKDLGIYISKDLKWETHINKIVQQASFISYRIIKSFRSKNIRVLLKLYKTYVRPKLEHNTPVWSPYLSKNINAIENVQRRFVKIICRKCNIHCLSYAERLSKLNLPSLQSRRIRFDLITLFKIVNNLSDLSFDSFFVIKTYTYSLRNRSSQILPNHNFKDSIWRGSFFVRAPRYWNKLSEDITSSVSLSLFKAKLKNIALESLL